MGSTQSVDASAAESEEEEEEEERRRRRETGSGAAMKKVLQQEPEMLPCHASASPLSPQLSSLGTPRIKVWDPYNVLAPPPGETEVFLISQGQCQLSLTPDLVGGRCPGASLTPAGKRQARALAVFLNSQGVRFSAVYSSPLDRARSMAVSVCQEMQLAEEHIQVSEALAEMSQGVWEGCLRSDTYSGEIVSLMESVQPDFSAPSGESLRQVEFRMVEFLNATLLGMPPRLHQQRKRSSAGKSRLQFMSTTTDDADADADSDADMISHPRIIGVFTHAMPIKCLLTGILCCGPHMSNRLCIDDSSITVLRHSWKTGWQINKLNDTAHLRLL